MSELHEQRDRATSFGAVAGDYDRARPSYPDALVHDLLADAHDPTAPRDVLDVGCGTGKAAVLFAAQGCRVLGVEPDPAMAQVARGHGIEVEVSGFEDWNVAGRRFDLLVSGQAWHWVDPVAGAAKAVEVLRPGGRIALFWNMDSMPPANRALLDAVYEPIAPQLMSTNRNYGGRSGPRTPVLTALTDAGWTDLVEREYPWQRRYSADEYIRLISTFSDHNLLPPEQRSRLFAALHAAVTERGHFEISYECHLVTALAP